MLGVVSAESGAIGVLAGWLALAAFVPYVRAILAGRTRPNRASWFIWSITCIGTALTYRASGAVSTIWVAYGYVAMTLLIAALSSRYGSPGTSALDWVCLSAAILSLIPWVVFRNAPASLYLGIVVDCFAALPTLKKAFFEPQTEDRLAWTISTAAMVLNVFAVDDWRPEISVYPAYCLAMVGCITGTLYLRGGLERRHAL